jgi:threonyl-tRNA synthetase
VVALLARSLWEASGHWAKFAETMFALAQGKREWALKPVSCPGHIQIFNHRVRSFRDLSLRFSALGACHRNEASGALHGLIRTHAFVLDDAHVFCREDHIESEVARFCALLRRIYKDFGTDLRVAISTRRALRAGADAVWDRAEATLAGAARAAGLEVVGKPGEGAFCGPKLEYGLRDGAGRIGKAAPSKSTSCCPSCSRPVSSTSTMRARGR